MKLPTYILASSVASFALLGACTPQPGPSSFSRNEVGQAVPVQFAEIISLREVEIRPGQTNVGTVAGGALGAIGGSQIGSSTAANVAGGVAGAVVGGAIGSALQGSSRTTGVEFTLKLDSGETIAVVQPGEMRDFRVGDRVRVSGTAQNTRVTH
ncbi:outer membrane lipoprotein SlyB [Novosphingobium sp. PhB165]|jgi:outer membrane lipoprotein SlyB|uniref:glycine zipper 2TM domain-containing protein n=1 Tax=Novosphingobium sp. PhB165 TaxID=2485105 RepID=UPI00104736E5|nr:glycine zipper 2TM domain-containing protein [Novosphingobium sp. PhB165]TCM18169.1 outer membrane lipoprotein SlyB [Novosphingobium sp. PhB165]